ESGDTVYFFRSYGLSEVDHYIDKYKITRLAPERE
ncbi:unnamed protein product, partial [marine sediment metagenome]